MKSQMRKMRLLVGTGFVVATMSGAAYAQTAVPPAKPVGPAPTTTPSTPSANAPAGLDQTAPNPQVVDETGDIVVTGFRQSLQNAQNTKRNASEIVDSIVAEDIGKLPDNNLAEALQRVPGVQITRNHGEGSGIAIRGLTQVRTLVNGREAFSDNSRDLSLENIPAEVLAGIDVYKNPSSTLVEGGLGGVVNLKTRRPFDFKGFQASVSGRMNYYDFIGRGKPQVSGLISNRFSTGIGEIGILLGAAYIRSAGRFDNQGAEPFNDRYNIVDFNKNGIFVGRTGPANGVVTPGQGPLDPGDRVLSPNGGGDTLEITDRTRIVYNGALQWKASDRLSFFVEGFYNKYDYTQDVNLAYANRGPLQAADDATFVFQDGTNVVKSGSYRNVEFTSSANTFDRKSYVWQIAGGGSWNATDFFKLSTDIAYTKAQRVDNSSGTRAGNNGNTTGTRLDFDTSGDQVSLALSGFDFGDVSKYRYLESSASREQATTDGFAGRLDGEYEIPDFFVKSISVGGRYTTRDVERMQGTRNHFPVAPSGSPAITFPATIFPQGLGPIANSSDFFRTGNVPNPIGVVYAVPTDIQRNQALLCQVFGDTVCAVSYAPANTYSQKEDTYAVYGQINLDLDVLGVPVDGNIGARYLRTSLSTVGVIQRPNGSTSPIDQDASYKNFLPSANLRFKITPELFLRFAAAKQLTRPQFTNLSPTLNISSLAANQILSINAGNPDLKPLRSTSYDASLEYYYSRSGYVYLSGFLKKVNGFIQNTVTRETVSLPDFPTVTQADINRPQNGDNGTIKGFEVGTQTFLDFLPTPLDGFGIQANYTFVDSKAPSPIAGQSVPLQGLSKNSYNLVGFYEKGGFRLRAAYTWRDDYVETTTGPGSGSLPIYVKPFDQLDASIGYSINDHFDISFDASNILNALNQTYFGEKIRPRFNNIYDRRFGLVIRIKS
ncbi:TonB-dependent receptor [Sphingomonas faeni]|uniref:TonB-dependent receptor n=1 Tax=Sphingomonas faeni TaxID=185950 RepID=UPI003364AE1E